MLIWPAVINPLFNLATDAKQHNGSLQKVDGYGEIHYIIPEYLYHPDDNGIRILRWLDKQHDFEKGLKTEANKLIREHFGIGTRGDANEFTKKVATVPDTTLVNNKTTSSKDVLHETVDFEELLPGIHDGLGVTVSFPDPVNYANQANDKVYTHVLPTILPEINLDDIAVNENLLVTYPAGDLLVDIIVNDKHDLDDDANLAKLRTYLGIVVRAYSKDAANINTQVFANLFGQADTSYFKDILDPASEQSTIIQGNVRMTILFCYINGNTPIYITLEKRTGNNALSQRKWYYRFHRESVEDTPGRFHVWDFGQTTSGAHPCPSIETTVHYITKNIDRYRATAGLQAISNFVSRQFTKLPPAANKTKLSKGQLQNANHYKLNAFDTFYADFLTNFKTDIGLTPIQFTNNIKKIVVMSFKTIGDQMYLYDAALIATVGAVAGSDPIPTVVSGDTFLRDYIIYTKSADIICPTTVGNVQGKRKLKVYLKPRITDPVILEAAAEARAEAEQAAIAALNVEGNTLITEIQALMPTDQREGVLVATKRNIRELVPIFEGMVSEGTRTAAILYYTLNGVRYDVGNKKNVMELYYNILEALLLIDEYNILKIEANTIKDNLINREFISQEIVFVRGERAPDTIIGFNNSLRSMKTRYSNARTIIETLTALSVEGKLSADFLQGGPSELNINLNLTRIKSSYPRGGSRRHLPFNVLENPVISLDPMKNELRDIRSRIGDEGDEEMVPALPAQGGGEGKWRDGKWYRFKRGNGEEENVKKEKGKWVLDPNHEPTKRPGVNLDDAKKRREARYETLRTKIRDDAVEKKRTRVNWSDHLNLFVEHKLSSLNQAPYIVPVTVPNEGSITEIAELFNVIDELVSKDEHLNSEYADETRLGIIQTTIKTPIISLVEKIMEVLNVEKITISGCINYIETKAEPVLPVHAVSGLVGTSAAAMGSVANSATPLVFGTGWPPTNGFGTTPLAKTSGFAPTNGFGTTPLAKTSGFAPTTGFGTIPLAKTSGFAPTTGFGTIPQDTRSVFGGPREQSELMAWPPRYQMVPVLGGRKSNKRIHHRKLNRSVKNKRRTNKKRTTRQKSRHNYTLKVNRYRKKN